jgi:membrane protein implicated in regulation of membrane protease activity
LAEWLRSGLQSRLHRFDSGRRLSPSGWLWRCLRHPLGVLLAIAILLAVFVLSPPIGIAVLALALLIEVGELMFWRRFLRRYRIRTGAEALVGQRVEVVQPCDPVGRVRVRGELWNAHADRPLAVGETARVTAIDGLTLHVAADD